MGWQDDPVVGGGWQSDPVVKQPSLSEKTAKADSNLENFNAAVGGTLYAPWLGAKAILGKTDPGEVQQWKDAMAGLWSTPMGKAGTIGGGLVAAAPAMMATGASIPGAAAAGTAYGALQPEEDWLSRAKNAAFSAFGSGTGQAVGNALATRAAANIQPRGPVVVADPTQAPVKVSAAPAAATPLEKASEAGLKIAPNEAGQQSALQWIGGQVKTQQTMASKNVSRATDLAAQEVGLPPGPITRDALQGVRDEAGKAYDMVKNSQFVIPSDPQMGAVAQGIENTYNRLTNSFKSLKSPEIETLISDLKNPAFDSEGLVEAVKRFRNDGFSNIAKGDPGEKALGRVQLQAQDALEQLIDRTLAKAGLPDAVKDLQDARVQIAKTYSIQNALDANGNVIASKLAGQLQKGKQLSGNLETIGQAAAAFPKSMQHFTATPPAFSALDFMAALGLNAVKGVGTGGIHTAMLAGRPIARGIMASGPYQNAFMGPSTGAGAKLLSDIANNPYAQLIERTGGLLGVGALAPQ